MESIADLLKAARAHNYASQSPANDDGEHHVTPAGEIRVRFPWQQGERPDDRSSRWVRVAQRQAGAGMGWQWLPRIGQEVLVKFSEDDIDQPVVIGALYNGQGEADLLPAISTLTM